MAQSIPSNSSPSLNSDNRRQAGAWMVLLAAFLGWAFDGLEMGIHPLVAHPALKEFYKADYLPNVEKDAVRTDEKIIRTTISEKDYVGTWNGRITAFFLIGAALGGFVFGWLGDKIGRVKAMTISILFYSGFTGLCYFAHSPLQMGFLRFLAALGMGGEWSLGVALVMEAWPANKRPLLAGLIGAASNVGFMGIAIFGMFRPVTESSWREVLLVGASPAILTFIIRIFVPESEKWHESVKKSGTGKPAKEVFGPQWATRTFLAIGLASVALIGTWGTVQNIPTWVSTATETKLKAEHTEADLATDSVKTSIATASASNKARSQIYSSVGAIIGCLIAPLLGAIFNRRIAYGILCLSSLGFCQWIFRGYTSAEFDSLFYFIVFMVGLTTASFYGWLPLYLPELFPTRIRATGQGIAFNFGRVLAAVGAMYSGELIKYVGSDGKPLGWDGMGATLSLVYIVGVVLILFCPETKGRPLPE